MTKRQRRQEARAMLHQLAAEILALDRDHPIAPRIPGKELLPGTTAPMEVPGDVWARWVKLSKGATCESTSTPKK